MSTANTPGHQKPGDPLVDPPAPVPVEIPPMPTTPEDRRVMLNQYSNQHESLTPEQLKFYDDLATQVATDEDAAIQVINRDPDVYPPEVVVEGEDV